MVTGTPTDPADVVSRPDPDLQVGQRVGEYVVEAKIGEGGFGTVFRAVHPLIGKQVAIKVLARQYSAQPEMVSRFVAEARAVNQIRHRNIIDIFAFGQLDGDGRHYYVMELLDGAPLDAHLQQVGRMALAEAIPVLRAIGKALDAAHAKGIAHRDLKPENIFLVRDPDGAVFPKLLDFGVAKLLGTSATGLHKTRTGAPIGTPYYMSPEQCRGRDVDHRTDVYSFGCVAYELLTGEVPFAGDDYMDILLKQLNDEPPAPSAKVPGLPASVDAGIAWMLKKDPAQRPADLTTAVRVLEQAAEESGIAVPRAATEEIWSGTRAKAAAVTLTPPNLGGAATIAATPMPSLAGAPPARRGRALVWLGIGAAAVAVAALAFALVRGDRHAPAVVAAGGSGTATAIVVDATPVDAAPASRLVTITVSGVPIGTEVYGPHGLVGVAPGAIQLERGSGEVLLTFRADGHVTASKAVTPATDQPLELTLAKKDAGGVDAGTGPGGKPGGGGKGSGGHGHRGNGKGSGAGTDTNPLIEDPFKSSGH